MTDTTPAPPAPAGSVRARPLEPIPQGSESLEVRRGGRHGTITCTPEGLDCLLRRPQLLGYDPMDFLTGWSNAAVACWPRGTAPGALSAY